MIEYKSSVLTCNEERDDCPVCRFLDKKRHWSDCGEYVDDLLHVIGVLDRELAKSETAFMNAVKGFSEKRSAEIALLREQIAVREGATLER